MQALLDLLRLLLLLLLLLLLMLKEREGLRGGAGIEEERVWGPLSPRIGGPRRLSRLSLV